MTTKRENEDGMFHNQEDLDGLPDGPTSEGGVPTLALIALLAFGVGGAAGYLGYLAQRPKPMPQLVQVDSTPCSEKPPLIEACFDVQSAGRYCVSSRGGVRKGEEK